jgi:DNA-binding NtrC family response regulator
MTTLSHPQRETASALRASALEPAVSHSVPPPPSLEFQPADASDLKLKAALIGDSLSMKEARALLEKIARSPARAVLISGESGVGKDVAARLIHDLSARADAPFTKIACTASSEAALEAQLFDDDADARGTSAGLLGAFSGGTILLDEISGLSIGLQTRLLRVLEEQSFERAEPEKGVRPHVRIVAATQRNLRTEVTAGRFREDLYYRLAVLHVSLPPLSAREGDVELLSKYFVARFSATHAKRVAGFSADGLALLTRHTWPGNVRELKYVIERAILLSECGTLRSADFGPLGERTASDFALTLPSAGIDLAQLERDLLRQALQRAQGNKTRAGALLGLTRDQVRHRVAKYEAPEMLTQSVEKQR